MAGIDREYVMAYFVNGYDCDIAADAPKLSEYLDTMVASVLTNYVMEINESINLAFSNDDPDVILIFSDEDASFVLGSFSFAKMMDELLWEMGETECFEPKVFAEMLRGYADRLDEKQREVDKRFAALGWAKPDA